jgi:N-methylhydantoinase A
MTDTNSFRCPSFGPAIIEEKESTLVMGEDASVTVDDYGFLWIDLKE